MEAHSSIPDGDDLSWILQVISGAIEEDISESSADHHSEKDE